MRKWFKKWLFCYFFHRRHRCYPEVWGRGLNGPWHCKKCHPCGEIFDRLEEIILERLCKNGINNDTDYETAIKIIDSFMKIERLTKVQKVSMETLISIVSNYEEKHYSFGN